MRHSCLSGLALCGLLYAVAPGRPRLLLGTWRHIGFVGTTSAPRWRVLGRAGAARRLAAGAGVEDPFGVLELPPGQCDEAEVKAAFRRLAKIYHPDVEGTGDVNKFQDLQQAAQQLLTAGAPGGAPALQQMQQGYNWASAAPRSPWSPKGPVPSANEPIRQPTPPPPPPPGDERVDVQEFVRQRRTDLRKTAKLQNPTHQATPETLAKVQAILAQNLGITPAMVTPDAPLAALGFFLEGHNNISLLRVAKTAEALENEFDIELITILVRTWIRFNVPEHINTVRALADYIESKCLA